MIKKLIIIVSFVFICSCTSNSYRLPDVPRGELKPQFSQADVQIQEELVEGWRIKCNKSRRNKIMCDHYRDEHENLQNFYYDAEPGFLQ